MKGFTKMFDVHVGSIACIWGYYGYNDLMDVSQIQMYPQLKCVST